MKNFRSILTISFFLLLSSTIFAQKCLWSKNIQGADVENSFWFTENMESDSDGNIYISGHFDGEADFDLKEGEKKIKSQMNSKGKKFTSDAFIAKYDPEGNLKWVNVIGSNKDDMINDMAIDKNNNVYVIGKGSGVLDLDASDKEMKIGKENSTTTFIAKYDSEGKLLLGKEIILADETTEANRIAIDGNEQIYICSNYLLMKLDKEGNVLLEKRNSKEMNRTGIRRAHDMVVDEKANIYVVGEFAGQNENFDFNGRYLGADYKPAGKTSAKDMGQGAGGTDAYIAKYSSNGGLEWIKTYGEGFARTKSSEALRKVKVKNGFVYAVGYLEYKENRNGIDPDLVATYTEVFMLKLEANGKESWKKQLKSDGAKPYDFDMDDSGNIYVVGTYDKSKYDNKIDLPSPRVYDVFIAKHTANGSVQWAIGATGAGYDFGYAITVNKQGVFISGHFEKDLDFGDSIKIESSKNEKGKYQSNVFLAKYQK
jgi:hypothetical protein